ncbi:hypothetical protein [Pseudomonas hormoni]|uniref:hypothetical protein n=1 Tax=Pseudomonas hormoni TaxID=3093767 RepID=UPI002028852D|nr:hypothetical protein [Pseudomonas hormoni]
MIDKMPAGGEMNGKQLQSGTSSTANGAGISKVNKAAIAYADNKRRAIPAEIKEGRFDYATHSYPTLSGPPCLPAPAALHFKRTAKKALIAGWRFSARS